MRRLHFTRDTVINEIMEHEFREHVGAPRSNMQLSAGLDELDELDELALRWPMNFIQPMNSKPLFQDSSRDSSPQTTTQLPAEYDDQPTNPKPSNCDISRDSSPNSIMQLPAVNDSKRSYRDGSRDSSPRPRRPQAKRMQTRATDSLKDHTALLSLQGIRSQVENMQARQRHTSSHSDVVTMILPTYSGVWNPSFAV